MFSLSACAPNACAPTVASWLRASNDRTKHSETLEENYVRQAPAQARSSAASQKRKKREGTLPTLPLLLSSGYICTCSQKCVCVRARMQVDLIRSSKPRSCLQGAARVKVVHTSMIRPKWPCAGCFLPANATQATLALWYKTEWRMKP